MGYGGLPSEIFEVTPSRTSENALLQNRIQIVFIIDHYVEKEKLTPLLAFIEL